jgi:hypothetical protein
VLFYTCHIGERALDAIVKGQPSPTHHSERKIHNKKYKDGNVKSSKMVIL